MACKIEFTKSAYKDFLCLGDMMKQKIGTVIDKLEHTLDKTPHSVSGVKKLKTPFFRVPDTSWRLQNTFYCQKSSDHSVLQSNIEKMPTDKGCSGLKAIAVRPR